MVMLLQYDGAIGELLVTRCHRPTGQSRMRAELSKLTFLDPVADPSGVRPGGRHTLTYTFSRTLQEIERLPSHKTTPGQAAVLCDFGRPTAAARPTAGTQVNYTSGACSALPLQKS